MSKIEITFGKIVKDLRNQKGISKVELADLSSTDPRHIQGIEIGKCSPSMSLVYRLACSLDIKPHELIRILEREIGDDQLK